MVGSGVFVVSMGGGYLGYFLGRRFLVFSVGRILDMYVFGADILR